MKYESEILYDLMKRDGLLNPSQEQLPYESELKEKYVDEVKGAYPKVTDYRPEWLNYNLGYYIPADFPTESLENVTSGTVNNVVPYAFKSAILKGNTGYHDIDTGEFLETFEEGRNLELVSVQMPVLTMTGKNLFDYSSHPITLDKLAYQDGKQVSWTGYIGVKTYVPVKENTTYTYSNDINVGIHYGLVFYDDDKSVLSYINSFNTNNSFTSFTTTKECKFIRFAMETQTIPQWIQLEEGTTATTYEPYKTNILTVNEDITLRGIGNIKDELDCLTGEVTERISEVVLNGSENITLRNETLENTLLFVTHLNNINIKSNLIYSDKFDGTDISWNAIVNSDKEFIRLYTNDTNALYIRILKSKLATQDVNGFKEWLSQNPITVQYELTTPIVKKVELNNVNQDGVETTFRPFDGTMHIQTDGTPLKPLFSCEIPVEATTQNLASFVNLEGVERTTNEYVEDEIVGDGDDEQLL